VQYTIHGTDKAESCCDMLGIGENIFLIFVNCCIGFRRVVSSLLDFVQLSVGFLSDYLHPVSTVPCIQLVILVVSEGRRWCSIPVEIL